MKMDKDMMYEAPEVLVLDVAVEAGFEASIPTTDTGEGGQAGGW